MNRLSTLAPVALALGLSPAVALAQDEDDAKRILLTGAEVVTMEGGWTEPERLDLLVEGDRIIEMGPEVDGANAEVIDLSGQLLMPGLVDTHRHLWTSLAQGEDIDAMAGGWTPEAATLAVKLGLAQAVNSGITWVNNAATNLQGPEYARAEITAMRDSGVRGRFSYGYSQTAESDAAMDLEDLRATQEGWEFGRIGLGVALRGPDRSEPAVWQDEATSVDKLGLPMTFHMAETEEAAGLHNVLTIAADDMLGPNVQVVGMGAAPIEDLQALADSGAALMLDPATGDRPFHDTALLAETDLGLGLAVENALPDGTVDMFETMRKTAAAGRKDAGDHPAPPAEAVLDWATRLGGVSVQAPDGTGELVEGGLADIIAISPDGLGSGEGLAARIIDGVSPDDVTFVMIGGDIHKQDGTLTLVDLEALGQEAAKMRDSLSAEAKAEPEPEAETEDHPEAKQDSAEASQ
ncbi:TRZ/ATZ family hydrolase [Salipiger pallidus]|uniref:TRZ/ATZ family hydrolase n=1 Tax=Salipiger pallidus TaxID=1775170 RepID=A0A8J2ZLZ6_9RHOB|nr:amidohydrolase family protein [Salipiger pallidus]GGG79143.1 TRZ/ATZ family hydrolase [Salipiger pallidus]